MPRPHGPEWLHDRVFYEIYPQSFYDSNGDGIGDFQGIIQKLDYIEALGANGIWLNPCYDSPFQDAGYDVADYYKVAPRYGTNDDLIQLFKKAHERDIKVILDLVPGHTSIEHEWFKQSANHERNKYSDWYIWTKNLWNTPPSAQWVKGYSPRNGSFMINFFYCQPALNYGFANIDPEHADWQFPPDHPACLEVREEMKNIMRFWMDHGADGFRVDMAGSLVKNDPECKETSKIWRDVRAMMDAEYPDCAFISEWGEPDVALNAGFHMDFLLHCGNPMYTALFRAEKKRTTISLFAEGNSYFDRTGQGSAHEFIHEYMAIYSKIAHRGYVCIPSGNHDMGRISTGRDDDELAVVFTFLLTMPGIPFIYYGDEIGMNFLNDLPSKEGGYERTGARTPMQWNNDQNSGFSTADAEQLYLPIDPDPQRPTVEKQTQEEKSLWNRVRQLAELRKNTPGLGADAEFIPLNPDGCEYPLVYQRGGDTDDNRYLIVLNPAGRVAETTIPLRTETVSLLHTATHPAEIKLADGRAQIKAPPLAASVHTLD
jgi:maltose alpha-D-glucosyltransferase/alpha-amylase